MNEIDIHSQTVQAAADAIARETERWCAKAIALGEGYRVFRSDGRRELDVSGHRLVHDFQILPPGAPPPPGSGTVFGPWTSADLTDLMIAELQRRHPDRDWRRNPPCPDCGSYDHFEC